MLTGLIFATEEATDAPGALVATLPFGGATLVEYQARLVIGAGAGQILIAVARVTPELLGAAARVRKRGVTVDIVRSAGEAAAKVHPLAQVVVLADGLLTDAAVLDPFAGEGGDLLLVSDRDDGLERIDAQHVWAGIARLTPQRLAEAAALPRDYDFLSTLLRVAAQGGSAKLILCDAARRDGHGIEREARTIAKRGNRVFAGLARARIPWVERWLLGPLARLTLPALVARSVAPAALIAVGGVIGLTGSWAVWRGWGTAGLAATVLASVLLLIGGMLAWLRGDDRETRWAEHATGGAAALALLAAGLCEDAMRVSDTGLVLALGIVVLAALSERLRGPVRARRWWASAAAYPLLLLPFAGLGQVTIGLAALNIYAALTLLGAIEDAREGLAGL